MIQNNLLQLKKILKKTLIILLFLITSNLYAQDSLIKPFINEWLGKPYEFGGESKKGIDCSSLVQKFYKQVYHVLIPRTCEYIFSFDSLIKVKIEDIQIGDILLFSSKYSPSGWHTGIYIGNDEFFHSSNYKEGVKISCIYDSYYLEKLKGIRRLKR